MDDIKVNPDGTVPFEEIDPSTCLSCLRAPWTDESLHFCSTCIAEWDEARLEMDLALLMI